VSFSGIRLFLWSVLSPHSWRSARMASLVIVTAPSRRKRHRQLEARLELGAPDVAAFLPIVPGLLSTPHTDARGSHSLILGSLSRVPMVNTLNGW
jgi:hypothetical protein